MNQGRSIIIIEKGDVLEAWGSITELCEVKGWSYPTVSRLKFPFIWDGWLVRKRKFRQEQEQQKSKS